MPGVRERLIMEYARERSADRETHDVVRIGPFLARFDRTTKIRFLNYAMPDDGAEPTAAEVEELVTTFRGRGLTPALEMLPSTAPQARERLMALGFRETARLPMLTAAGGDIADIAPPEGVDLRVPMADTELADFVATQRAVFEDDEVDARQVERLRAALAAGANAVSAVDASGNTVGAAQTSVPGPIAEIVGVAVLPSHRRRGIAGAMVAFVARAALDRGLPFVSIEAEPGADGAYRRAGFRDTTEVIHLALEA